ncbi:MAG: IreB family regulatory phosphoprotein [Lachnospiraceae bacterium]|nr:IreB family regulatory phosphoprotein [Lachnospiraceae bacterium]
MEDMTRTQFIQIVPEEAQMSSVRDVLASVYAALTEKGYNPVNQIVGYIMSGDPTYITSHKNARSMIMKVERDELVEELLRLYIGVSGWSGDGQTK